MSEPCPAQPMTPSAVTRRIARAREFGVGHPCPLSVCGCLIDDAERKGMSPEALRVFARELEALPADARLSCS